MFAPSASNENGVAMPAALAFLCVGYEVDDDDMVFHAINGLPEEEYASLKQTLRTHRNLKFHELVSILKSEEHQTHKSKTDKDISSVFVATQKLQDLSVFGMSGSSSQGHSVQLGESGSASASVVHSTFVPQPSQSQASPSF
ncbi:hypothetical protein RHMOL_Rhmol07G0210700 [Rhododendron molle]|uniref:Uncharacterized protein n=1 Tax=Rhododendron molle TaxID=49168 RepID=A0ACC0N3R1_RHOML|nr:hypothetical protein RHMOL_Rhmol07G0210700 [Rhododendron molle]